jgi:hypothetical protein
MVAPPAPHPAAADAIDDDAVSVASFDSQRDGAAGTPGRLLHGRRPERRSSSGVNLSDPAHRLSGPLATTAPLAAEDGPEAMLSRMSVGGARLSAGSPADAAGRLAATHLHAVAGDAALPWAGAAPMHGDRSGDGADVDEEMRADEESMEQEHEDTGPGDGQDGDEDSDGMLAVDRAPLAAASGVAAERDGVCTPGNVHVLLGALEVLELAKAHVAGVVWKAPRALAALFLALMLVQRADPVVRAAASVAVSVSTACLRFLLPAIDPAS